MGTHLPYSFEDKRFSHRNETRSTEALKAFVNRLGLSQEAKAALQHILLDYVTDVHLRITWYSRKIKQDRFLRNLYISLTILLIGVLPILLILVTDIFSSNTQIAQVSALLSGLLGIHKGFASWLEQRRVISGFWKAKADIKEALYELEDKHKKASDSSWEEREVEDLKKDMLLWMKRSEEQK